MRIRYPRIQNRPIRFALAGCGRISNSHFEAITQRKNRAEHVAVCDVDTRALNEIQNKTGVAGYTQYTDLLAAGGFDCVILTTPSGLHPQQTIQAGFHVMTGKPMATRWKDGVAMVKACDDAGVRFVFGKAKSLQCNVTTTKTSHHTSPFWAYLFRSCQCFLDVPSSLLR